MWKATFTLCTCTVGNKYYKEVCKLWSNESMCTAIKVVKGGPSVCQASIKYGISRIEELIQERLESDQDGLSHTEIIKDGEDLK